jgi:hypothetical protein
MYVHTILKTYILLFVVLRKTYYITVVVIFEFFLFLITALYNTLTHILILDIMLYLGIHIIL